MRSAAPRTDLDWLCARFEALYEIDTWGRLAARRAPDARRPPRFVFGRTRLGCIWRFGAHEPESVVRDLARYAALEPPVGGLGDGPPAAPERLEPMRRTLEAEAALERVWSGPIFRLFEVGDSACRERLEALASGSSVVVDASDSRLAECAAALETTVEALCGQLPLALSTFEGRIVSVCRCVRGEAKGLVHARVETDAAARGHGHAPRAVAAWAVAVAELGGAPLYAADWKNRASLGVARKLGLVAFAEGWSFS